MATTTNLNETATEILLGKQQELDRLKLTNINLRKLVDQQNEEIDYLKKELVNARHLYLTTAGPRAKRA